MKNKNQNEHKAFLQWTENEMQNGFEGYYVDDNFDTYASDGYFDLGEGITLSEESGLIHVPLGGNKSHY